MEPETDDIILQEEVEVNETPGVQMGGFYDINKNPLVKYFLEHSGDLTTKLIGNGYVITDKEQIQINIQFNFDAVKAPVTIFIPPIGFYFDKNGKIPVSYNEYVDSLPKSQSYKVWKVKTNQAEIKHRKNIFDKLIYDLLFFTQKELDNNNLDNAKAYISIASRMYVLILGGFFLGNSKDANEKLLAPTNPINTDTYDLFNALQILRALGMFGAGSWLLSNTLVKDNTIPISPPFDLNAFNIPVQTIGHIILTYEPSLRQYIATIQNQENYVYYFFEYIYQWHSTLLYTLFKVNEKPEQDEVKTYKEFRNTAEFLKAMPGIIDQAFRSQAVSSALGTVGDPTITVNNVLFNILSLLKRGAKDDTTFVGGALDTTNKELGEKIYKDLVDNLNTIKTIDPKILEDIGFNVNAFKSFTAPPTDNDKHISVLKNLLTSQKYYDQIKNLVNELIKNYKALDEANLPANTLTTVEATELTALTTATPNPTPQQVARSAELEKKKNRKPNAELAVRSTEKELSNLIKEVDVSRLRNAPLNSIEQSLVKIQKVKLLDRTVIDKIDDAIATSITPAQLAILQKDLGTGVGGGDIATKDTFNNRITTYNGEIKTLRDNLIDGYKNYKNVFAANDLNMKEMETIIDKAITVIEGTASLTTPLVDDATFTGYADKTAELNANLTTVQKQLIDLKKLVTAEHAYPAPAPAPPAVPPPAAVTDWLAYPGANQTIPAGDLAVPPKPTDSVGERAFVEELNKALQTKTGGSKRNTRRNRNRKNSTTRRNNEMTY